MWAILLVLAILCAAWLFMDGSSDAPVLAMVVLLFAALALGVGDSIFGTGP